MRRNRIAPFLAAGATATLALGACSTTSDAPQLAPATFVAMQEGPGEEYVIGPLDKLTIHVWRNDELGAEVQVRPDGRITTPLVSDMPAVGKTPTMLAEDIAKARKAIEDACGVRVTGYRAPSFSIDQRTPWAFMELVEQGYDYSSSVAPVAHDHYGWAEAPRFAFKPLPWADLIEIPVTTAMFAGKRLAAGGGGFFRVLPYGFSRWAIRQVNRVDQRPAIFYFHPWEIDPGQPRVAGAPLKSRLRHYTNLDKMAPKLRQLVHEFAWGRMDVLAHREKAMMQAGAQVQAA